MKKLILLMIVMMLSIACNRENKISETSKQKQDILNVSNSDYKYDLMVNKKIIDDIEFLVITSPMPTSSRPVVLNLTKEKLEIQLLRKQLENK